MKIFDILATKGSSVWKIDPASTVQHAIRRLCEHRVGALVVERPDGALAGILTERDVLVDCGFKCSQLEKLAHPGEAVCPRQVQDIMTTELFTGSPDDELEQAMGVMVEHRVRHLPIVDGHELVGIVSMSDLVRAKLTHELVRRTPEGREAAT
jgi:CBS domain-containing protein